VPQIRTFDQPLSAVTTSTSAGATVRVTDGRGRVVAEARFSRAELRELLERSDMLASLEETAEIKIGIAG
jgi:hypothetical protein